ncbi:MAG: flagellar hook-associated protein FlgK, partial [Clostridium sp.]
MSGLFYTFNIAKRGMSAQQTSLHVVSHNVSNLNTYGYSKQRAVHSTTQPYPMPGLNSPVGAGQLGTGVEISEITRARDQFIDSSIRRETSSLYKYGAKDQFLNSIEGIINEPGDTGLSNTLTKFWDAWQGLATHPENASSRKLVISNANALADSFRQTYNQLEELEKELAQLQRDHIYEVNSLLKQIADVNDQIKKVTISGQMPNDLMDRRDVLLDKLSENINFKIEHGDHNSVRIITTDGSGNEKYLVTDGRVINGIASIDDVNFTMKDKDGKDVKFDKADFPLSIDSKAAGTFPINMELKVYIDGDLNRPSSKNIVINDVNDLKKYFNVEVEGDKVRIDSIKNGNLLYNSSTLDKDKAIQDAESFDFTNGAIKGLEDQKLEIADYKNQLNNMSRTIAIAINAIHTDGK